MLHESQTDLGSQARKRGGFLETPADREAAVNEAKDAKQKYDREMVDFDEYMAHIAETMGHVPKNVVLTDRANDMIQTAFKRYEVDNALSDRPTLESALKGHLDAEEMMTIPQVKQMFDLRAELADAIIKAKRPYAAPVVADNRQVHATIAQGVMSAVKNGQDVFIIGNAQDQAFVNTKPAENYQKLYDSEMPKALKKLAEKYGVKVKKFKVTDPDLIQDNVNWRWGIEITPEMKKAIEKYGIDLYSKVENPLLDRMTEQPQIGGLLGLA